MGALFLLIQYSHSALYYRRMFKCFKNDIDLSIYLASSNLSNKQYFAEKLLYFQKTLYIKIFHGITYKKYTCNQKIFYNRIMFRNKFLKFNIQSNFKFKSILDTLTNAKYYGIIHFSPPLK